MKVTFKLYATLMQYLPAGTQGHAVEMEVDSSATIEQLIGQFNITDEMAYLVMLNGIYIQPEDRAVKQLSEQDTLAIWPKVAGG